MQKFAAFEKNFRHARMHTRSIIEFANVSYSYNFYRNDEYTRLVQTSAQTQDKNATISGNLQQARSAKFPVRLATSAEREVPRATCNEREVPRATCNLQRARSSPRHLQQARSAKFPAQLATSAEREVPRATCNERGARSSPRDLQRARSAKFPAQKSRVSPITQRAVNVARCVLIRNCSRLSYLL